jgi:hypothetical protein
MSAKRIKKIFYTRPMKPNMKHRNQCCGSETKVLDPVSDPDPA